MDGDDDDDDDGDESPTSNETATTATDMAAVTPANKETVANQNKALTTPTDMDETGDDEGILTSSAAVINHPPARPEKRRRSRSSSNKKKKHKKKKKRADASASTAREAIELEPAEPKAVTGRTVQEAVRGYGYVRHNPKGSFTISNLRNGGNQQVITEDVAEQWFNYGVLKAAFVENAPQKLQVEDFLTSYLMYQDGSCYCRLCDGRGRMQMV